MALASATNVDALHHFPLPVPGIFDTEQGNAGTVLAGIGAVHQGDINLSAGVAKGFGRAGQKRCSCAPKVLTDGTTYAEGTSPYTITTFVFLTGLEIYNIIKKSKENDEDL